MPLRKRLLFGLAICLPIVAQTPEQTEFFEKRVRPVLAAKCSQCHNAKTTMGAVDLTSGEAFHKAAEEAALISLENPEDSRLLRLLGWEDKVKMPPTGKLPPEELAAITQWVKSGAEWPGVARRKSDAKTPANFDERKEYWSFQPMKPQTPPTVKNAAWAQSPIDKFILAKLEDKKVAPAKPADKMTLLRRVTFDLTGLAPTEQEIRDFTADSSPGAFRKVVDRLLASPRYGEKWGRNWLDVARYADSTGNDEDHRYPHAWRYRDYVIEAFNKDLPYDQFVREQLAGDLLPSKDGQINRQGIIATGFLAVGQKAIAQQDKKKMLYDVYDEQVDVVGKAFLGLTVACARCHDHKFDPILTKDYYSMTSIFASTKSFEDAKPNVAKLLNTPLVEPAVFEAYKKEQDTIRTKQFAADDLVQVGVERFHSEQSQKLAEYMIAARKVAAGATEAEPSLREDLLKRWVTYLSKGIANGPDLEPWVNLTPSAKPEEVAALATQYQDRSAKTLAAWSEKIRTWRTNYKRAVEAADMPPPPRPRFDVPSDRFFNDVFLAGGPFAPESKKDAENLDLLTPAEQTQFKQLKDEVAALKKNAMPEPDMACAVAEGQPVQQHVFVRGDYNSPGEPVAKTFPLVLASADDPKVTKGSGRLELAQWLTTPDHPLTARVMVNRLWNWHFSEGIVRTPDNFGLMGEKPTHPELLDYLAQQFVSSGWSMKAMHRTMLLSSTYQMGSAVTDDQQRLDPENRLFSRFPRRRLGVEEIRDSMLAIDGSLDLTMGGTLQKGVGTDSENSTDRLSLSPETLKRRTVYLPLRRSNLPSLLNLFDFGDAAQVMGKRQATNIAPQALFMMNSAFVADRAKVVSSQILKTADLTPQQRVEHANLRILNRAVDPAEVDRALTYLQAFQQRGHSEPEAWQSYCQALMASNAFIYVD